MLVVVLNGWVTETNDTPVLSNASTSLGKSSSERVVGRSAFEIVRAMRLIPKQGGQSYILSMKLHGSVEDNLAAALRSARRLRGQRVHGDTLQYWRDLLSHAGRERVWTGLYPSNRRLRLMTELEAELAKYAG